MRVKPGQDTTSITRRGFVTATFSATFPSLDPFESSRTFSSFSIRLKAARPFLVSTKEDQFRLFSVSNRFHPFFFSIIKPRRFPIGCRVCFTIYPPRRITPVRTDFFLSPLDQFFRNIGLMEIFCQKCFRFNLTNKFIYFEIYWFI